jgi:hypothetical protein
MEESIGKADWDKFNKIAREKFDEGVNNIGHCEER